MLQGIIGRKLGISRVFGDDGEVEAVTIVQAGPCTVTQVKTQAKEGYNAVQLGFGDKKRLNLPEKGHLKATGMFEHLREFRVEDVGGLAQGSKVDVSLFKSGELVDVIGVSKGKGFAGVVKRHHFAGGPKTHGQSDRTRAPGAIGSTTSPGRVLKGRRMAGHMGNARATVQSLRIVKSDSEHHLLLLAGGVPGARNGLLLIRKSTKQRK